MCAPMPARHADGRCALLPLPNHYPILPAPLLAMLASGGLNPLATEWHAPRLQEVFTWRIITKFPYGSTWNTCATMLELASKPSPTETLG